MANSFTFELVSPEKLLLSGDAEMVTVPGSEGDMGVLANHAPVMISLRPGIVGVTLEDGTVSDFFVRGGFADITPSAVTVLAEFALPKAEMTRDMFDEQKRIAQEDHDAHHAAGDEEKRIAARAYLDQLNHLEPTLLPA